MLLFRLLTSTCLLVLQLQLVMARPHSPARANRGITDALLSGSLEGPVGDVSQCYGNASAGLCSTSLTLQYRSNHTGYQWLQISDNISLNGNFSAPVPAVLPQGCAEFRLVQEEHGGGNCNCWQLTSANLSLPSSSTGLQLILSPATVCDGSASVPRSLTWTNSRDLSNCSAAPAGPELLEKPFNTTCSTSQPHINVSFQLNFDRCNPLNAYDEGVELSILLGNSRNWIPVAFYYLAGVRNMKNEGLPVGHIVGDSLVIRGYQVQEWEVPEGNSTDFEALVCGFMSELNVVQFRWLQTSRFTKKINDDVPKDVWTLDNIEISYQDESEQRRVLLNDSFDSSELNTTIWPQGNIRSGIVSSRCTLPAGRAMVFGLDTDMIMRTDKVVSSRSVKTVPLAIVTTEVTTIPPTTEVTTIPPTTEVTTIPPTTEVTTILPTTEVTTIPPTTEVTTIPPTTEVTTEVTTIPTTEATTAPPTTEVTTAPPTTEATTAPPTTEATTAPPTTEVTTTELSTTENADALAAAEAVRQAEDEALAIIANDTLLSEVFTAPPSQAISGLQEVVESPQRDDPAFVALFLLGSVLNRTMEEDELPLEATVAVGNGIIGKNQDNEPSEETLSVEGASLFSVMDDFLFNHFSDEDSLEMENIGVETRRFKDDDVGEFLMAIDSSTFDGLRLRDRSRLALQIPREILRTFSTSRDNNMGPGFVRLGSVVYNNVSGLLPSSLPGEFDTELGSGVVSTSLQCGAERCPTDKLNVPVMITFQHSEEVEERLNSDNTSEVTCVFLDIFGQDSEDAILRAGQWSVEDCYKNENLSNNSVTVCECFHLTNFAILLSAAPLNTSAAVTLSLEIIGYVGVAVSLVAMALTIITFLLLKPLRNMRNFVHINLCISLGIAQIIFVAAVGTASGSDDDVPTHCQAVAVLLHYFFLVSFMWMLMEGVVLYVALVRVFVKRKKLYMLAFAVASYGVPLLYLGTLTLPLGFALQTQPNYGYSTACFLNPATHFIWAFIVPVVVIIFINFGFFIMAATIMWRHQKKLENSNMNTLRNWLKAAVSLVVIMGLTWILGVLIVEVDQLLPLAYIYTILVAFQGLFIFLIFVLLSKQVREAYSKWWRAKVNESDVLSKYFGDKYTLSTSKTGHGNSSQLKNNGTLKLQNLQSSSPDFKIDTLKVPLDNPVKGGVYSIHDDVVMETANGGVESIHDDVAMETRLGVDHGYENGTIEKEELLNNDRTDSMLENGLNPNGSTIT